MSGYTPGPWMADEGEMSVWSSELATRRVADCRSAADARLIAAAPELLQVLEEILEMAEDRQDIIDGKDGQPRPDAWMRVAQTAGRAVAKAKGGVTP